MIDSSSSIATISARIMDSTNQKTTTYVVAPPPPTSTTILLDSGPLGSPEMNPPW